MNCGPVSVGVPVAHGTKSVVGGGLRVAPVRPRLRTRTQPIAHAQKGPATWCAQQSGHHEDGCPPRRRPLPRSSRAGAVMVAKAFYKYNAIVFIAAGRRRGIPHRAALVLGVVWGRHQFAGCLGAQDVRRRVRHPGRVHSMPGWWRASPGLWHAGWGRPADQGRLADRRCRSDRAGAVSSRRERSRSFRTRHGPRARGQGERTAGGAEWWWTSLGGGWRSRA
jgi:hypothetical protein